LKLITYSVDDRECGVNGGESYNQYGISLTFDMGTFDTDTYSDYIDFRDSDDNPSFIVHRVSVASARPAPANPPDETYKQKDPVGFALKKEAYRLKLGQHFGVRGTAPAFPCQCAEDSAYKDPCLPALSPLKFAHY